MGKLVNGTWTTQWYDTKTTGGRFVRGVTAFRDQITADGSSGFRAEAGRYHLYVSMACPWAHRTLIVRQLKGLAGVISVSGVDALMLDEGWVIDSDDPGPVDGLRYLHQLYTLAAPDFTGRVTVPVLWDKQRRCIVNNESAEIIRMFNTAFADVEGVADVPDAAVDLYPEASRPEIDAVNARIYETLNNGVYRCGFATTQAAYDEAVVALFDTLDWLEARLEGRTWLVGPTQTEADWRLFTTLVRFDAVYHGHFKCNRRRLADYPALHAYLRRLYHHPGVSGTVDLAHARRHYYGSHRSINPHGIVPIGPELSFL